MNEKFLLGNVIKLRKCINVPKEFQKSPVVRGVSFQYEEQENLYLKEMFRYSTRQSDIWLVLFNDIALGTKSKKLKQTAIIQHSTFNIQHLSFISRCLKTITR